MNWKITRNELTQHSLLNEESLFALGNGYLGVRGNFEEGYKDDMTSIRGTYLNGFYDIIDISYGERLYGFPKTQQKIVNNIDAQTIQIYFGEGMEERFSLFEGEVLTYNRYLHLDGGFAERIIHWRSPKGKEFKLHFRRLVSFITKELFAVDIRIEPVNYQGQIRIVSTVNNEVSNYNDSQDPRVGSSNGKHIFVKEVGYQHDILYVLNETLTSGLNSACLCQHKLSSNTKEITVQTTKKQAEMTFTLSLSEPISITKWNIYLDTLRHKEALLDKGKAILNELKEVTFDDFLAEQKEYLTAFWQAADITIEGDTSLQEGIRFNLFHLLQGVGKDQYSNISAKGLSGEGYEGHYFWDTEIYISPVFLMTQPEIARNLLLYRYSTLDNARRRAKEMGHSKGALFPWRTISGSECSSFFPAGTAQYHISADVAYSYIQYYLATKDKSFLEHYGAEVLFETARLWIEIGHYHQGKFKIDAVTGPDEYTCIVNNNYYTNVMAKHNLRWAAKVFAQLQELGGATFQELCCRLQITEEEVKEWIKAAEHMYLPYDEIKKINPQDDTFLQKAIWNFNDTPKDHYPLLLHYHPLTLYRYQVCKQADTVLAHFLLEDEQDLEIIKNSYDYYERITTHDSSLSSCIFSIMASKVGYQQKAYNYFMETARLDLDNTHGNTKDGLHMANMGGAWMSIVYGFGGVRLKDTGLSLAPSIPKEWQHYAFCLRYGDDIIAVYVDGQHVVLTLLKGEELRVRLYEKEVKLQQKRPFKMALLP